MSAIEPTEPARFKARLEDVRFGPDGLIPAVIVDAETKAVLTLAYMNREALSRTLSTGETWLFSRSRQALWHKGETSGHTQAVVDLILDCDGDALVVEVVPHGPACHTGERSCFHRPLSDARIGLSGPKRRAAEPLGTARAEALSSDGDAKDGYAALGAALSRLSRRLAERRGMSPDVSYTAYLFAQGRDKILKKVAEETAEVLLAAKDGDRAALAEEAADLFYHLVVLLDEVGLAPEAVAAVLDGRAKPVQDARYRRTPAARQKVQEKKGESN